MRDEPDIGPAWARVQQQLEQMDVDPLDVADAWDVEGRPPADLILSLRHYFKNLKGATAAQLRKKRRHQRALWAFDFARNRLEMGRLDALAWAQGRSGVAPRVIDDLLAKRRK